MKESGLQEYIHPDRLEEEGFTILPEIYSIEEIARISTTIDSANTNGEAFRRSKDLYAIRGFLKRIPEVKSLVFNEKLKMLVSDYFGSNYFVVKSIYFDKPASSNWFVSYHQDLTISVDRKVELENFTSRTEKNGQFAVQPPVKILENIFTVRIHLDDTTEENGALKVIPGSHSRGILRPETLDRSSESETSCNVAAGGIMIMKPLLLHSSGRTLNEKRRRVIHIEFSDMELPEGLNWAEKELIN